MLIEKWKRWAKDYNLTDPPYPLELDECEYDYTDDCKKYGGEGMTVEIKDNPSLAASACTDLFCEWIWLTIVLQKYLLP